MEVAKKQDNEKYCADCAAVISVKAEICPKCGIRQTAAPSSYLSVAENGKSKLAAALFAIFLGGLGVHKFYLGQVGQGFLYVLICWTFIPSIIGLVEGILLLGMNDKTFDEKYGKA